MGRHGNQAAQIDKDRSETDGFKIPIRGAFLVSGRGRGQPADGDGCFAAVAGPLADPLLLSGKRLSGI